MWHKGCYSIHVEDSMLGTMALDGVWAEPRRFWGLCMIIMQVRAAEGREGSRGSTGGRASQPEVEPAAEAEKLPPAKVEEQPTEAEEPITVPTVGAGLQGCPAPSIARGGVVT